MGQREKARIGQGYKEKKRLKYPEKGRESQRKGEGNQETGNERDIEEEKDSGKESQRRRERQNETEKDKDTYTAIGKEK